MRHEKPQSRGVPFGAFFAALVFVICALGSLAGAPPGIPGGGHPLIRTSFVVVSVGLALALVLHRRWARWAAAAYAAALVWSGLGRVQSDPGMPALLLVLVSLATLALLLIPATGRFDTEPASSAPASRAGRLLGWCTLLGCVGLALGLWAFDGRGAPGEGARAALRAARVARVSWSDFGRGLELARAEEKPLLVTFVASWCPYCRKMDRTTWKSPRVLAHLDDVVPVRVDAEESRERNGYTGVELARRYRVSGYPTTMILDTEGRVLSRLDGLVEPETFGPWLERWVERAGPGDNLQVSRP